MSKWLFVHTYVVPVLIVIGLLWAAVLFGMAVEIKHGPEPTPVRPATLIKAVYPRIGEHPPSVKFAKPPDSDLVLFYINENGDRINMKLVRTDSVKATWGW